MILEVFISYAHQDHEFRDELDKHLSNLRRQGIISSWSDTDIAPGTEWQRQVVNHLDTAQIILLLISADFMASDFCYSTEMMRALERHRAKEARVLPIILRPTDWQDAPFAALEALPADGKPVTRWPTVDDAFENVVEGIRRAIRQMAERNERAARAGRIGQRFGDYWLRQRLGGGSFGDVYLGEQVYTHGLAAVKVLHVRLTRAEELRAFINEVRTFRLQHPHIVRLLDVGIAPDETPFLVMEYAAGGTMRDRHPKGSRLPLSTVLTYVAPIASALQYAHDLRLVHRDIKPENMLLGAAGELWLSDFGIATVAHSTGTLTTEGMGGTLPYMAPEQILGRPRPQSDQYALAIVIYEWLTGSWPFRGTPIEIAMQHHTAPPPALRTHVPTVPAEVEQVVLNALSKDPKDRFGNVQAFATALVQAAQTPLEQNVPSLVPQEAQSTMEDRGSERAVEATGAEQLHVSASLPATGPQTTPSPSIAEIISESLPSANAGVVVERARHPEEEEQASQAKRPVPATASVVPVPEAAETAPPEPIMPSSQQPVSENSADRPAQSHALLPLSDEERLRQTGEDRRQAEEETARQEQEQTDTLEEERARKAQETILAATEPATSADLTPPPAEVIRASKSSPLRPDALVAVKPAKPGASRRFVLLGLAGLVMLALTSGIAWFTAHRASPTTGIQASPTASIPVASALSISEFPIPTDRSGATGIAAGPGGTLWFTEEVSNKIGSFTPDK